MVVVKSSEVICLYRDLLRYGRLLKYTDKQFYFSRMRAEFEKHRYLTEAEDISFYYQKGLTFLQKKRIV